MVQLHPKPTACMAVVLEEGRASLPALFVRILAPHVHHTELMEHTDVMVDCSAEDMVKDLVQESWLEVAMEGIMTTSRRLRRPPCKI